uniref:beta-propeller fold lactonase family protein n=1 Tax=Streptomyces venezuelae TaxID=54571 RepID=UPI001F3DDBA0
MSDTGTVQGRGAVRAYIGSFTSAGGRGVLAADVDAETGALTVTGASDALADPSFLALAGPVLHAVSETEAGAVAAFDVSGPAPLPLGASGVMVMLLTYGTVIVQVAFPFTLFHRKVKNVL